MSSHQQTLEALEMARLQLHVIKFILPCFADIICSKGIMPAGSQDPAGLELLGQEVLGLSRSSVQCLIVEQRHTVASAD